MCPPSRASCPPFSSHHLLSCPPYSVTALGVLNAFLRCPPWSCLPLSPTQCLPSCFLFVGWPGVSAVPVPCLHFSPAVSSPTCVSVLDVASAFLTSCLPLSPYMCACVGCCVRLPDVLSHPLSPHMCACVGWCLRLPVVSHSLPLSPRMCAPVLVGWCVRLLEALAPIVSHGLPKWCVRLPDVLFPNCLPLSPHVCLSWIVCPPSEVLSPLVSLLVYPCLRLSLRVSHARCLPLSPIFSHCLPTCACFGWSTFPKSCFSLSPIVSLDMCACVGWCVRLLDVLSPRVSHCLPLSPHCLPLSPFLSPRLPLSPVVCHCFPLSPHICTCARLLDRLPRSCLPIVSHYLPTLVPVVDGVSALDHIRLPEALSPNCLPTRVPVLDVVPAFPRSCLRLSPIVSPHVCLCWYVCLLWPLPCLPMSPTVSPHVCLCWMVCPPSQGLVSSSLPLFPTCDHVHFPEVLSPPCLPLSPFLFPCVGWCVRLPEVLPPLSPSLSPSLSSFLSPSLSANLSFFLFPFVAGGRILHFFPNNVRSGVLNAFSCPVFDPVPQPVLNPQTVWGLRWCHLDYGGVI